MLRSTTHVIAVYASSAHVHWRMASMQRPVHSAPLVFPAKIHRSEIAITLKTKLEDTSSENFLATGDFFEYNTYRVTALGCLKKKEDKEEDEQFWLSTVSDLPL